jgi:hypothetical protein
MAFCEQAKTGVQSFSAAAKDGTPATRAPHGKIGGRMHDDSRFGECVFLFQ